MKNQLEQDALFVIVQIKVIELFSSGHSALIVHVSGKKHADVIVKVKNFLKPRTSVTKRLNSATESQPGDSKQKKPSKRWITSVLTDNLQ